MKRRTFLQLLSATVAAAATRPLAALSLNNLQHVDNPYAYPYRSWEDFYREPWSWDSVARSTHGLNCTGSCTFNVFVRDGVILREEQVGDYPEISADLPSLNPRGCQKGACYAAEYVHGDRRIKYPLIRTGERGEGLWRRASWDEALDLVADGILDQLERGEPDAINFFSPIPAMSPVSFSAGIRLAHLLGGVVLSFYDWYCDLPPGSPITLGEQTDVAESSDWLNSRLILLWGSNPVQTRIPDAHFLTDARYRGTRVVGIFPEFASSAAKVDRWLPIRPGTDGALALALCEVLIRRETFDIAYLREQTDLALLVRSDTGELLREADLVQGGSTGRFYFRCLAHAQLELAPGSSDSPQRSLALGEHLPDLEAAQAVGLADGRTVEVQTVFRLLREQLQTSFTAAQMAPMTGIAAQVVDELADELWAAALDSGGAVTILHGAGCNHWYHNDLSNRAMLLLLSLLGAIGKPGGGFNHYVGQEKFWAQDGLRALCYPEGTSRQRFQNTTLWAYVHGRFQEPFTQEDLLALGYRQPIRGYLFDAVANGWMPLYPEGCLGQDKEAFVADGATLRSPRVLLVWRGNWLNQAKGNRTLEQEMLSGLDLLVNLNFQMDSTALFSDVVLPAASHYEKYDLSTTDLHTFIHPMTPATPPLHEALPDWEIFRRLAERIQVRAAARGLDTFDDPLWSGPRDLTSLEEQFTDGGTLRTDRQACQFLLDHAPETVGMQLESLEQQPRRFNRETTWTSPVEPGQPYTPFLHMTRDKQPYQTLTGRQQYYIDHAWFLEMGEALPTFKPPLETDRYPLRYNTPHGRWSVHSTFRNAPQMLRLQRGGPICYLHPDDMERRSLQDNDLVRIFNDIGTTAARVCSARSQRIGMVTLHHGWERYQSEDGVPQNFNALTTLRIKPTQLAGGYGQLHFSLNYWGPTGVQRDIRVEVVRADT